MKYPMPRRGRAMLTAGLVASTLLGGMSYPAEPLTRSAEPKVDLSADRAHKVESTTPSSTGGVDVTTENHVQGESIEDKIPEGVDESLAEIAPDDVSEVTILDSAENQDPFTAIGVTWDRSADDDVLEVKVSLKESGGWSDWETLRIMDDSVGDEDSTRSGTDPLFSDVSTGYRIQIKTQSGEAPAGLKTTMINPGEGSIDADMPELVEEAESTEVGVLSTALIPAGSTDTVATKTSATSDRLKPTIVSRASWGANESLVSSSPSYTNLKAIYLHHTASSNNYDRSTSVSQIRSIFMYQTVTLEWGDIGYHFLVDKYGTVYEGQRGGVAGITQGAHARGFNSNTIAISAMGNYDEASPPAELVNSITQTLAWKAAQHGLNPNSTTTLISSGNTKYAYGTSVVTPTFLGHYYTNSTDCPGRYLKPLITKIATDAKGRIDKASGSTGQTPAPAPTPSATYTVKPGDSWWGISQMFGMNMNDLASLNGKTTSSVLQPGMVLKVRGTVSTPAPPRSTTPTGATWGPHTRKKFTDVSASSMGQWAANANIDLGTSNSAWSPESNATRLQIARMMKNYMWPSGSYTTSAPDVGASSKSAVGYVINRSGMTLDSRGYFNPSGSMSRADFAKMLSRVTGATVPKAGGTNLKDVRTSSYNSAFIEWAYEQGYLTASDGYFRPGRAVTRNEAAYALNKLHSKQGKRLYTVTNADVVNVRRDPSTKQTPLGTVGRGSLVRIIKKDSSGMWSYVTNESFTGWMHRDYLG